MKKIICSILLLTSISAIGMTNNTVNPAQPTFDDTKEFTPQILAHFEVPQPLLDALKNPKNKKGLRYLGLRLYNRRVAPLNSEGEGDYLDFETLRDLKVKITNNPTEATIQGLAHWVSRKPIPRGSEVLKKQSQTYAYAKNQRTTNYTASHLYSVGDCCEKIGTHINHIAQNEDWTPHKTERVMVEFCKIYLNLNSSSSSTDTTTKGK